MVPELVSGILGCACMPILKARQSKFFIFLIGVPVGSLGIHLGFQQSSVDVRWFPISPPLPMTNKPHSMKTRKYACISLTVCTSSPKVQIANRQYCRMLHHSAQFMAMAASSCGLRRKHDTQKITRMGSSVSSVVVLFVTDF